MKKDYTFKPVSLMFRIAYAAVNPPTTKSPTSPYSLRLKCRDAAKTVRTDLASSRPFLPSTPIHTHPLKRDETNARGNSGILRQVLDNRGTSRHNSMKLPNYNAVELCLRPITHDFLGSTGVAILISFSRIQIVFCVI